MNRAYKARIAASKAALDAEMRAYAATLVGTKDQRIARMRGRFPTIDPEYASELVR